MTILHPALSHLRSVFKTQIVVSANHNFMLMRKAAKPFAEIANLRFLAFRCNIASMNKYIAWRDLNLAVLAMSVRDADNAETFLAGSVKYLNDFGRFFNFLFLFNQRSSFGNRNLTAQIMYLHLLLFEFLEMLLLFPF